MSSGENRDGKTILELPENWEEIKEKYLERYNEKVKEVAENYGYATFDESELLNESAKRVSERSLRFSAEHVTLTEEQRHVITNPKDPATKAMAKEVAETLAKTDDAVQKQLSQNFSPEQIRSLQGRVKIGRVAISSK